MVRIKCLRLGLKEALGFVNGFGNFGVAKLVKDKWTREMYDVKFIERDQKVCFVSLIFVFCFAFLEMDFLFCVD